MSKEHEFVVTCPKGLEGLLRDESSSLGLLSVREQVSAVKGTAALEVGYRLCLWSRLANRVLLVLKRFPVQDVDDLYQGIQNISWSEHLDVNGYFSVEFSGKIPSINNTYFGALKVKDAIVDQFRETKGARPSVDKTSPDIRIHVHLEKHTAVVSIDLSGRSLHQRGYRLQKGDAPLKENLAAALLIRSNWMEIAKQGGALADPMCGAGTFLIEAAKMAADIAPNLSREDWGFTHWLQHESAVWRGVHDEASSRAAKGLSQTPVWIRGYEADPRLIQPARNNIERAGLSDWIKIYQGELATFEPHPDRNQKGLIICNPPYGERLGDEASLLYLYQNLGKCLRENCLGWSAAIFTGNTALGKRMGIRSHKQYSFWNGALPCKLLLMRLQPEQWVIELVKIITKEHPHLSEGGKMFANRLQKNLKQLKRWIKDESIECFRLYDADMPEYALSVDIYKEWVHVHEYAAPSTVDPDKAQSRLFDALAAISSVLNVPSEHIILKRREKQQGNKQYQRRSAKEQFLTVNEGGVQLLVNLTDYLDTGLFLDHRPLRLRLQKEAKGKNFLNLFCYTASASVHAAKGGALKTTSVDLSKKYLDWAKNNLAINGFSEKNELINNDVMKWLTEDHNEYDLILIDPPTFSNSKKMDNIFDVQRDHVQLIDLAMAKLTRKGVVYFSNNFRKFKLDEELNNRYVVENITTQTLDQDFARNTKIHQAWRITIR
ncbi:UNVERIFIED_CONTAM: hypothetical protein GTU68_062297 [Idotea baltica]|nr:hypothetical protein [Idotea baltica]